MLWLLLSTAAHAQDVAVAAEAMAPGTIGDYTGPVSIVVGVLFALDKANMLRLGRGQEPPPPAENAQTAALDARLKSAENAVTDLQRRADESQVQRTQYDERIRALRREFDAHCTAAETARAADRAETAARLDRIADAIDTRR